MKTLLTWFVAPFLLISVSRAEAPVCSATEEHDPALREMIYNIGEGEQSTYVYVEPDIASFYQGQPPASTKVAPKHRGFSAKFINASNRRLALYWVEPGGKKHLMREHAPFTASGTASFPGHKFVFTPPNNPDEVIHTFVVQEYPDNIQLYDPYFVKGDATQTQQNLATSLNDAERAKYQHWRDTIHFHEQYLAFTGRSYLANYLREPPRHFMWRADYFGQEHWVTTQETRFVTEPPPELLSPIAVTGNHRQLTEPVMKEYREPGVFNMTLKTLSCAPGLEHILKLAQGIDLKLSSTGDVNAGEKVVTEDTRRTRTSFNSWVERERSPIVDAIYRRAADLLRIDESLMRYRNPDEHPELPTRKSVAESLQLVHYAHAQEYTAHHDFGFSRIEDDYQGARFATLLLYLNEGMVGGETSFPRWVNAETFLPLNVKPEKGKAVLFYSQLPDGNLDDFSHHAALPVTEGEKWLMNLWVWDPIYE